MSTIRFPKISPGELFLLIGFLIFSSLLMFETFRVTPEGNMQIATKAWSDFAATIPLIRSFSYGSNFPPEYPIFAGPPIRYHFMFFALTGFLEKIGIRLDSALNGLSVLFLFLLLVSIYYFGKVVFKSSKVGVISVVLLLFNGSLGFLEFFKKNPISPSLFSSIMQNTEFSSFGPYDGKVVSAFWNLNIYTNQRHLALAYAAFIFFNILIYIYSKKPGSLTYIKSLILGAIIGSFPFIHQAVFGTVGIALAIFFLIYPKLRSKIVIIGITALVIAVPQFIYMGTSNSVFSFFHPGYLAIDHTIFGLTKYWFLNLGLTMVLTPIGFLIANKDEKKASLPFFALFLVGNLFQFSPEIAANHKFFNLFAIGANMLSAVFLIKLAKIFLVGKMLSLFFILLMTLTGIIDFFPIINDRMIEISDIPNNPRAEYIYLNTDKNAVFLNTSYLYDPASIAGRKIYMGWPYFSWGLGYDTDKRFNSMKLILTSVDKQSACKLLKKEKIDYLEVQYPSGISDVEINFSFFDDNFHKIYSSPQTNYSIYDIKYSCGRLTE